jgi:hypothetical protein
MDKAELQQRLDAIRAASEAVTVKVIALMADVAQAPIPPEPEPPQPVPPEPVRPPTGYVPGKVPRTTRTIKVEGSAGLNQALAKANPGDRIELAPGSYDSVATSKAGTPDEPICIVGNEGVTVANVNLGGPGWVGLYGCKVARAVNITCPGGRISRCWLGGNQIKLSGAAHPKCMVDYVSWRSITGMALESVVEKSAPHKGMYIGFCHVLQHQCGAPEEVMRVLTSAYDPIDLTYECILFEDCMANYGNQREIISIKTAGTVVRGCTFLKCRDGSISMRETRHSVIEGNYLREAYIRAHGDDHLIRNNDGKVLLCAGDETFDAKVPEQCKTFGKVGQAPLIYDGRCRTSQTATRRTQVTDHKGEIVVGYGYPGEKFKVVDIVLRNNSQAARRVEGSFTGLVEEGVGKNKTTVTQLTPQMVGWKGTGLPA